MKYVEMLVSKVFYSAKRCEGGTDETDVSAHAKGSKVLRIDKDGNNGHELNTVVALKATTFENEMEDGTSMRAFLVRLVPAIRSSVTKMEIKVI